MDTKTSLREDMAMPEEKPYRELFDGEVLEKCMGFWRQQMLITEVMLLLGQFTQERGLRSALPYLSCADSTNEWVLIPALSYASRERMPWKTIDAPYPIPVLAEFVVEVLGEGEDAGRFLQRIVHYLNFGVELLWVIDPDLESVTVWRPNSAPEVHESPAKLSAAPVLADFELDLTQLFDSLRR